MTQPISELRFSDLIGDWPREPRLSEWMLVPQDDINHFGRVTKDPDRNHIDPAWALEHSPFGGPIAFGFQTLSLLTYLAKSARVIPIDVVHLVNYGFDRVRFTSPIPAGAQIRGRYRDTPSTPSPVPSGEVVHYRIPLPHVSHSVAPGHRLMIQVQCSWFPLYDRNPQRYVPQIAFAQPQDYVKATQRVFRSPNMATCIELPVID